MLIVRFLHNGQRTKQLQKDLYAALDPHAVL